MTSLRFLSFHLFGLMGVGLAVALLSGCVESGKNRIVEVGTGAPVREHRDIISKETSLPEGYHFLGQTIGDGGARYSVQLAWLEDPEAEKQYFGLDLELYQDVRQSGLAIHNRRATSRKQSRHPTDDLDEVGDLAFQVPQAHPEVVLLRGNAVAAIKGEPRLPILREFARFLDQRILAVQDQVVKEGNSPQTPLPAKP